MKFRYRLDGPEVLRGVVHKGLLESPTRLLPIVEDAAHAIYATDAGMTETDMFHIAESFRGLTTNDVQFIEAIPHGATGKILKTALRKQFEDYKLPTA